MARYNDYVAVTVVRGKKDVWSYVSFLQGLKLNQFLTADGAANTLAGLRATNWTETHKTFGNREVWEFRP